MGAACVRRGPLGTASVRLCLWVGGAGRQQGSAEDELEEDCKGKTNLLEQPPPRRPPLPRAEEDISEEGAEDPRRRGSRRREERGSWKRVLGSWGILLPGYRCQPPRQPARWCRLQRSHRLHQLRDSKIKIYSVFGFYCPIPSSSSFRVSTNSAFCKQCRSKLQTW